MKKHESSYIVEDCFTSWLIHDEGEFIFSIFKELIFLLKKKKNPWRY